MPRPSMKDQRSEEILDAYLTCVARFGLEGATQERIAAEAGVKRPLLRHYLGNKDQMIDALADHVISSFDLASDVIGAELAALDTPQDLVAMLFTDRGAHDPRYLLAWQALAIAVADHQHMREPLLASMQRFLTMLQDTLARIVPSAPTVQINAVAQGISALFINADSFTPLGPPAAWRAETQEAAMLLASTLTPYTPEA